MKKPDLTGNNSLIGAAGNGTQNTGVTGRHIVMFEEGAVKEGVKTLKAAGLKVIVSQASNPDVLTENEVGDVDAIVFPALGAAVVVGDAGNILHLSNVASDSSSPIKSLRPEKIRHAIGHSPKVRDLSKVRPGPARFVTLSAGYLEGYRDAVNSFVEKLTTNGYQMHEIEPEAEAVTWDESAFTWGLQATRVTQSNFTGRGVRVAVLDTGIDFDEIRETSGLTRIIFHPDFEGRAIATRSFVAGTLSAKDGHGHGTHCIGTVGGPRRPAVFPRYGVAFECEIFAGKVLNDQGSGADGWIIAGIEWAINNRCHIVSMSLGSPKMPGDPFDQEYEEIAQRAIKAGTLIIAAAGNDSERPNIHPVSGPADCPSILAVAAVFAPSDESPFSVAPFSNGGINGNGGEVNIAAPGVKVRSSFLRPVNYRVLDGTSMATPHVAGIAALYAESNPNVRGRALWDLIMSRAKDLPFSSRDIGVGFVQAP